MFYNLSCILNLIKYANNNKIGNTKTCSDI